MSVPGGLASLGVMPVLPSANRKKMVRRVLHKRAAPGGARLNAPTAGNQTPATGPQAAMHRQQSSMAALLSSAHEDVDGGLEAPTLAITIRRRERRERPPSPASVLRRLAVVASYSPFAVSLPILLNDCPPSSDRFRDSSRSFWGVVMFCDISGFTKLAEALALGNEPTQANAAPAHTHPPRHPNPAQAQSYGGAAAAAQATAGASTAASAAPSGQSDHRRWLQRAGADTLVTIINQIFHRIVSLIVAHGGDVIKFAGDALLSVWRPDSLDADQDARAKCALAASKAALEISACMANFEAHGVKMSVHSGLACGQLVEMHLGGFKSRWEYLIAGHPILAMGRALDVSQGGDVVAHGSVWELISDHATGILLDSTTQPTSSPTITPAGTAKSNSGLTRLIAVHTSPNLSTNLLDDLTLFCPLKRERAEDALSSYIPEPAMALMQSGKELITGELRQVTILFVSLPDFEYNTVESLRRNQAAVVIIQQVLYRFDGVMRQLIQDDKGTVCIVAFGLPYSTHEDDPLRGVLTAIVIKKNLEAQLGMRSIIGVTTGDAYCFPTEDTRILTEHGFMFHDEVARHMQHAERYKRAPLRFAAYDPHTKQITFVAGKLIQPSNTRKKLIGFTNSSSPSHSLPSPSIRVTPNHRMWVRNDDDTSGDFRRCTAEELQCTCTAAVCAHTSAAIEMIASIEFGVDRDARDFIERLRLAELDLSEEQIQPLLDLYAIWVAHGAHTDERRAIIFTKTSTLLRRAAESLHIILDFEPSPSSVARITDQRWIDFLVPTGGHTLIAPHTLTLAAWVFDSLAPSHLRILIDALARELNAIHNVKVDSTAYSDAIPHTHPADITIYTRDAVLCDQLLTVATLAGYSAHFVVDDSHSEFSRIEITTTLVHQTFQLQSQVTEEEYHGDVWCIEVAHAAHLLVAQRAVRDPLSGALQSASRPLVVGNCGVVGNETRCEYSIVGDCFHGDTPVVRSDGFSAPIRDITVGTSVLSFHAASAGHRPTHTSALLDRGTKECIELLFSDGRTVTCTPNHRLMTDDGEWVEAGQLSDGVSWIKAGMEYPSILHDDARDSKWSLDLTSTLGYTLNMIDRHSEALAFAGLAGYMFGGGDISSAAAALHLTSRIDVDSAMRDVTRLTNSVPASKRSGSTFAVELPAHLHRALIAVGASASSFPPFVLDPACPPAVIQSFLGGLFGSDAGVAPIVNWSGGGELAEVKLSLARSSSHNRQQRARTTSQFKQLLARLDIPPNRIKANTIQSSNGSHTPVWSIPRAASPDFACKIGFRYCCQKQLRLTAASTYYRRRAYIESQRKFIRQYVRAIGTDLNAATFESAVQRALVELSTTQVIHPDIAAWTPDYHRRSELFNNAKRIPGITVKQALEACDVEKLFRCALDPAATSVPTFRVQLVGKRKLAEAQHVFDISVPETVNFLAAGLCAHNCVNLSARLMGHAAKLCNSAVDDPVGASDISSLHGGSGILCDGDTESHISQGHDSSHGIHFQTQGRVPVKGRKHEVAIFTPLFTDQAQSIGKPDLLMFGRRNEMGLITSKMESLKEAHVGGVIVLEGEAGMGKTRIVQEVVANINLHTFLSHKEEQINKEDTAIGTDDDPSSPAAQWNGVGLDGEGNQANVRVLFGSGNSMTSKIAYSIWRNIIPGLLTELVEGRLHGLEYSRSGSHAPIGSADHPHSGAAVGPESDRSVTITQKGRRSTNTDQQTLVMGGHTVARIASAGARRKLTTGGSDDVDQTGANPNPTQPQQVNATSAYHSKHLITEQLTAAGLHEDEFCLINRFFPNNSALQFPETSKMTKLKPLQIARKLSKVILNLLVANYQEYGPLLLILENIQWLDTMSWRVVDRLTRKAINGVTILLTTRPASFSQSLKLIINRPHTTYIKLDGLDQRDIEGLCCLRLKVPSMPRQMAEMITKASNGNPLFVQELLLSLQQTSSASNQDDINLDNHDGDSTSSASSSSVGKKRRPSVSVAAKRRVAPRGSGISSTASGSGDDSDSNTRRSGLQQRGSIMQSNTSASGPSGYSNSINALFSITASMQQIMTSRIDKLTPRQQDILKAASVIGMNFSSRLVSIVCSHINPAIVEKELIRMDTMGFIQIDMSIQGAGGAASPSSATEINDVPGGFRHAVMQDVTYKLMSKADRSALHLRVAEALEHIENSREALRYLPYFTTLGLFMLPAWMEDQAMGNADLVAAGLVDEHGNVLVETDENGEPVLDDRGYPIPLDRPMVDPYDPPQQSFEDDSFLVGRTPMQVGIGGAAPTRARHHTQDADITPPPPQPANTIPDQHQNAGPRRAPLLNIVLPVQHDVVDGVPVGLSVPPSGRASSRIGRVPVGVQSSPESPGDPRGAMDAPLTDGNDAERGDTVPETSELIERANAAKELAYHFNMAGVTLKALVYWDLASAIFLTMQEATESKKLMQLAVQAAVILAPIKHVKLFTRSESPAPDATPKSAHRGSASTILNLIPSATSQHSPSSATSSISTPSTPIASSTVGSLRLVDSLCLAKWERRLGESCRLLEEEDDAHSHLHAALKHLSVALPAADTALLNPQNVASVNSTPFLGEGCEGAFERVSFLTEVAHILLNLSQCHYTYRPHEPLVGMHSSFLCLQAAQKAGHVAMMAAAYADLLLGCLSLGDLELVEIYYALASALVDQIRETPTSSDASSAEMAKLLSSLAAVNISFGRWTDANSCSMEAYQLHRKHGDSFHLQECIQGLALLHRLSGHLSLSSALYSRLQHIASHQQHVTSPYFLPRAMLGLIENLCLSGANSTAMDQLKVFLLKGEEMDDRACLVTSVVQKEPSRSHKPSRRSSLAALRMEPQPGGMQWASQPEVNVRWKALMLLLKCESNSCLDLSADALALMAASSPDPKPAATWNFVPRPAFHLLEASSALTQMLCSVYMDRMREAVLYARQKKRKSPQPDRFTHVAAHSNSSSSSGDISTPNTARGTNSSPPPSSDGRPNTRKEMDRSVAAALSNANLALLRFRRLAEKMPIGRPRLLIWQGVLQYAPGRVGQSMSLWLEAAKLAKSLSLPRDVGLACFWLSQVEVIPAPWWACCTFLRAARPTGAPSEEWRDNYRAEAIHVFTECGFGLKALGIVAPHHHQQHLMHHPFSPKQTHAVDPSMANFHRDIEAHTAVGHAHARFMPNHADLALDLPQTNDAEFQLAEEQHLHASSHSRHDSGSTQLAASPDFSPLDGLNRSPALGPSPIGEKKNKRKGIGHFSTTAPDDPNNTRVKRHHSLALGDEEGSDSEDSMSEFGARKDTNRAGRLQSLGGGGGIPAIKGAAGKYAVGTGSEDEELLAGDHTLASEQDRVLARRRRAERAGILPANQSSSKPARPSSRRHSRQGSINHRPPRIPTQSSSDSDDEGRNMRAAALIAASTSPPTHTRTIESSETVNTKVAVGMTPQFNATQPTGSTPGNEDSPVHSSGVVSARGGSDDHDDGMPPDIPHSTTRRNSVNLTSALPQSSGSVGLNSMFLSPAGPKGLDAFRSEVAALHTSQARLSAANATSKENGPHTPSPISASPTGSKSAQQSRAHTPAIRTRKGSLGLIEPMSDIDAGVPSSVLEKGTLPNLGVPSGAPPAALHSRRNSIVHKSLGVSSGPGGPSYPHDGGAGGKGASSIFGAGEIFSHSQPRSGIAHILGALDLSTAPASYDDANIRMPPAHAFNFIPKHVLFAMLSSSSTNAFMSTHVSDSFEAVVLCVQLGFDGEQAESDMFRTLSAAIHVILSCAIQYDGRLLNPLNHSSVLIMFESSVASSIIPRDRHRTGLADVCRRVRACAQSIRARLQAAQVDNAKRGSFSFHVNDLPTGSCLTPTTPVSFDRLRVSYVLSAGSLALVECPGVQQSVRQYFIVGQVVDQALEYSSRLARKGSKEQSPRTIAAGAQNGGDITRHANHQIEYIGLVSSILGDMNRDHAGVDLLDGDSDLVSTLSASPPDLSTWPQLSLGGLHGMQSISEDPDSARWVSTDLSPAATSPVDAQGSARHLTRPTDAILAPSHTRHPINATDESQQEDHLAGPKMTNIMVLQRIGQFSDATMLKRAFALFIPRLHTPTLGENLSSSLVHPDSLSPISSPIDPIAGEVSVLLAHFSFASLDEMTNSLSMGLGSTSPTIHAAQAQFTSTLNTLVQVLRYLLTLFPASHMKMESVGTGLRVTIAMEQNIMILSCAIRLLSAFQATSADPSLEHLSFSPSILSGVPVSCCIGIGSGPALLAGVKCEEANNQWTIVGSAIDRAEAALRTSIALNQSLSDSTAAAAFQQQRDSITGAVEPDAALSQASNGGTGHPFRAMDNSHRIILCPDTYAYASAPHSGTTSVVVERVDASRRDADDQPRMALPNAKRPTADPPIPTGTIMYRLIRFRHSAHFKLAQTSLCGRWAELQTLMSMLPTLDRIPRATPAETHTAPKPPGSGSPKLNASYDNPDGAASKGKPGAFVLVTGESGVGKSHLISAFKNLAARTVRERIFTVRLNAADQSTPWGCLRALVAAILETEAKYDGRLGQGAAAAKNTLTSLFQQTMGNLGGQSLELLPYLACLNSLLPVNCLFAETRVSKQLSSGDRAEFTLTLLTYLFVFLLEPRPFLLVIHNGEFIDSLSWVGIKRVSTNFSKSFFLVSAGAISAMDRSTNAGPMLKNLNHYSRTGQTDKSDAPAAKTTITTTTTTTSAAQREKNSPAIVPQDGDGSMPSESLDEFAYTEISLRNLQQDEIPSVIMNYLGLVHVAASFIAFMIRQTAGHPQLLIHSLELMLSHGSLQDPKDTVVYSLDHIMFGFANAGALASSNAGVAAAASAALAGMAGSVTSDHASNGMSSVLGLHPSGAASDAGSPSRPAQVSMHELTLERIHALSSSQSLMLRVGSIIGASFDTRILREVHPANPLATQLPRMPFSAGTSGATPRLSVMYINGIATTQQTQTNNQSAEEDEAAVEDEINANRLKRLPNSAAFEEALQADLAYLTQLDLIQQSGDADAAGSTRPMESSEYVFVSSAIRDLVYGSMDKFERTRLHTLVARYYEREARIDSAKATAFRPPHQPADTTANDALSLSRDNLLAYHWRQAGDAVKQFVYTLSSARKSLRMHANREATHLYTQAIALRQQLQESKPPQPATTPTETATAVAPSHAEQVALADPDELEALSQTDEPAVTAEALALYSPRSRQALDPLEVLHYELSSACRNLSLYGRSTMNLLEVLCQMGITALQPWSRSKDGVPPIHPGGIISPADRLSLLRHLESLDPSIAFSDPIVIHGPIIRGFAVGVSHPAWFLAAKAFEKIGENSLRTGEALLGFKAILMAVQYYQAMEEYQLARAARQQAEPDQSQSCSVTRVEMDLSSQAAAYGLLSVYCASFGFKSYEHKYMLYAKDLFLSNPSNQLDPAYQSTIDTNNGGKNWNARVTLANYESMYLVGMSQLDDALNLLIDMQMGAADTFLGGHRSHRDLLFSIGLLFFLQGDYQQTMLALEDVLALARAHKDAGVESNCLNLFAFIHILCDAPHDAMDALQKSKSLHLHSPRKTEKNVLCHTLLALSNLRLTVSLGAQAVEGSKDPVRGRSERHTTRDVSTASNADAATNSMAIQRALDNIYHGQHSIDVIFGYYANRLPLLWHDFIDHMGLATYLMEVLCWIGGHLDVNRKDSDAGISTNSNAVATDAGLHGTFSSSNAQSSFAPLPESDLSQLRSLHATCLNRLKVVHSKLLAFEQRFPWSHALTSLVSGALIMLCGDESQSVAAGGVSFVAGLEQHYYVHDAALATDEDVTDLTGDFLYHLDPTRPSRSVSTEVTGTPNVLSTGQSLVGTKVPLHAALECWQSGMKLSTEHHMTHLLAHAHFLFGIYLRIQDPARRVHLQTARAIWNANGSQHYANLAGSALCHLSYFDLGLPLQHRLSPFTPYSDALLQLHAEKSAHFTLMSRYQPTKGILRHNAGGGSASSVIAPTTAAASKEGGGGGGGGMPLTGGPKRHVRTASTDRVTLAVNAPIGIGVGGASIVAAPQSVVASVDDHLAPPTPITVSAGSSLLGSVATSEKSNPVSPRRIGSASSSRNKVAPSPQVNTNTNTNTNGAI